MNQRSTVWTAASAALLVMVIFVAPLMTAQDTAASFGAGPAGQAWLLSSMSLGLTLSMLTVGAAGDDFGRRRVFVWGAVLLAAACAASAIAPGTLAFVLARVVAGIGGAAVFAGSLAVIGHAVSPGPDRGRATALWGAGLSLGLAAGVLVAPLCARYLDWRSAYWIFVVAALVLAAVGARVLTESTSGTARTLDLPGVVLLGLGLASLLAGLTEGRTGWARPLVLLLLAVGIVLLVVFVLVQARAAAPMIDLTLFRGRAMISATVGSLAIGLGVTALMSFLPTVLQRALHYDALHAALVVLPWAATTFVVAYAGRTVGTRFSSGARMAAGLVITFVGLLMTTGLHQG